VPLLNKAGGAGFQVTAYTQTWSDVEARIGNRAKAGNDPVMPENLTVIANEMERTYITNDHWYRVRENWWHGVADVGVSLNSDASDG
jgi:hypothetical protein